MSQRHSPPPHFATSQFPAPATNTYASTRLTRTALATKCDLRHTLQPHDSLRLPRKSHFHTSKPARSTATCHERWTISYHVSFNKICTTPHVWNDFDAFWAHSRPPKSPQKQLRCNILNANPNVTATSNTTKTPLSKRQSQCDCAENCGSHKTLRLRSEIILHTFRSTSYVSTRFRAISHESDTSRFHTKTLSKNLSPMAAALAAYRGRRRSVADGWQRLRTLRQRVANKALPPDPQLNENPSELRYALGKKKTIYIYVYISIITTPRNQGPNKNVRVHPPTTQPSHTAFSQLPVADPYSYY